MKIVRYRTNNQESPRIGRLIGDLIEELREFPWQGAENVSPTGLTTPVNEVSLLAPIERPSKIMCIGLNYRDHAAEAGLPVPGQPLEFTKHSTAITDPNTFIHIPDFVTKPDWEAELAIVIGKEGKSIHRDYAFEHVLGLTCFNDVSARDIQASESHWVRAKSYDTFAPLGPWIVTVDEFADPNDLKITCSINGSLVQDSRTSQLVFGLAEIIEFVSQSTTLLPGDIIATGTPPGVGVGMNPPRFLHNADVVTVEIEGIGQLTNTISRREEHVS